MIFFFWNFICTIHLKVWIIHENFTVFFPKMIFLLFQPHHLQLFTRLSLRSIHQPPWTTNLKLLLHLKSNYPSSSHFLWTKNNNSSTFSLYSSEKPKILILKFLRFIELFKLTILGGSLSFELLCAWRRLMCAKQVFSLI